MKRAFIKIIENDFALFYLVTKKAVKDSCLIYHSQMAATTVLPITEKTMEEKYINSHFRKHEILINNMT
jgi:hypothetical protein